MSNFWRSLPLSSFGTAYAFLRIVTGALMAYHGWEIFDGQKMADYAKWLSDLQFPAPAAMAYLGKASELVSGLGLLFGLLTRLNALLMAVPMLGICFGMGHGKFWYEDQHPFLFVLLGALFFFGGGGKWSLDARFFDKKTA
jgi:putative oxidoreductase